MSMVLEIFIKYSFWTYSHTFSQHLYFLVDKYFFAFFISTNFFHTFTQYIVLWTSLFHKVLILWITFLNSLL